MLLRTGIMVLLVAGYGAVQACLGPENVFGIQLNNGEPLDVGVIEKLGVEGINYHKSDTTGLLTYSFRSHYNASIMVTVTTFTDTANKAGIVTFTVDTSVIKMESLAFGTCVRTELDWLVEAGVISMDRVVRERIEQAFATYKDPFNTEEYETITGFFWTRQDSLVPNNASFALEGDSLNIVRTASCGDVAFAVTDLPPDMLEIVVSVIMKGTKKYSLEGSAAGQNRPALLLVDLHGRVGGAKAMASAARQPGIMLGYDRRSGAVKKMVVLP